MNNKKTLWISVMLLSIAFFCALGFLPMEVHFGWDMPFVELGNDSLDAFGYKFVGYEKQLGAVMLSGIMMMLPARTIHLALIKLTEKKR